MAIVKPHKIARGSAWLTSSYGISKFLQLVLQVCLARLLSPEQFGIWGMAQILAYLSTVFNEGTTSKVLVQRGLDDKHLVDVVYSLGINVSVALFLLQGIAGFGLAKFFDVPQLWPLTACAGLVFLIQAGAGTHGAVLLREMKFRQMAICDVATGVGRLGGGLTCAAFGGGVWSFVVGEILGTTIDSLLKRYFSGYRFRYYPIPDRFTVSKVSSFITGFAATNLAVFANTKVDNVVIGKLLGAQTLGYYNMAYQLAMLPQYTISRINNVNLTVLSRQDSEGKRVHLIGALELTALFSAPIYGLAFVGAPWGIPLLLGSKWVEAVLLFQIIIVYGYARGFMSILGVCLNASNRPGTNALINWALVPFSVLSFVLGAKLGGATGVAIAVAVVMGIGGSLWTWLANCRVSGWKIGPLLKPVTLPTFAISLTATTVLTIPFPANLLPYLQPLAVLLLYGIALTIFSGGRVPRMLVETAKRSLKIG